jgi:biotin carboxyl carrier protein
MTFDVAINGRSWRIAIDAAADNERGRFLVTLKGRKRVVDAVWIDPETISLIAADSDAGGPGVRPAHEVGVRRIGPGDMEVSVAGRLLRATVAVAGAAPSRGRAGVGAPRAISEGRQSILAPMPGRVVRVLVKPGERISAGQGVVVVEAMKMENELRSPKDGVVQEVSATEGTAVDAGAVLAVIE